MIKEYLTMHTLRMRCSYTQVLQAKLCMTPQNATKTAQLVTNLCYYVGVTIWTAYRTEHVGKDIVTMTLFYLLVTNIFSLIVLMGVCTMFHLL